MREILFRGKRKSINKGEWIYGSFVEDTDLNACCIRDKSLVYELVDRETVGQYTGLTDKNGKKIFEGDIVSTKYKLGRGGYYVFEVYYNENLCQFALTINSGSYTKNKQYDWLQLTSLKANKVEIIGNIHDNPELLEV